jgi:hypothetical protein
MSSLRADFIKPLRISGRVLAFCKLAASASEGKSSVHALNQLSGMVYKLSNKKRRTMQW